MSEPKLIYQDKNFLVLEKPAGLLVHKALHMKTVESTVVDWLVKNFPETGIVGDAPEMRPGIVHRLDKTTSGLMVVAGNQETFEEFKKLFQERRIVKKYFALVRGKVKEKEGVVSLPLVKSKNSPRYPKRRVAKQGEAGKYAETRWRVIQKFEHFTLLEVEPKTGRTHQIRVHLAASGHPIAGDRLYGNDRQSDLSRPFLHATTLDFSLFGTRYKFESPLPKDLQNFLDSLK